MKFSFSLSLRIPLVPTAPFVCRLFAVLSKGQNAKRRVPVRFRYIAARVADERHLRTLIGNRIGVDWIVGLGEGFIERKRRIRRRIR